MGSVDALKYGDVWILAEKGEAMPSEGHAIDHIGWRTHNGPKREGRRAQSQGREVYNRAQTLPRHPHFLCRRSGGRKDRIVAALRALFLSLLLLEKRQGLGDALVRISRGNVVSIAADHDESRIRNLHLVSPYFFDRIHFAAIRRYYQRRSSNALQDALLRKIEVREGFVQAFYALSIWPAEERVPIRNHLLRRV